MLRYAALVLGMLAFTGQAEAISRYNSTAMSCSSVQARIAREGAAIMRYRSQRNPSLTLYDRYVANEYLCPAGHIAVRAHIPTADTPSCPVLRCKPEIRERLFRRPWVFGN
ncbi:hypothetical protein [Nitratireductor sp. ZSWI3]|uniref:hypothetical protein n=1 Tax=Nitratireductor sp. ZSWI3 TaxID=2966359 RepID=UPI00214FA704|nr:hypothetical protein [Nitratireductor sp. ZSWI3]MCR4266022.1 hypothetical protein [Nitratireductor sp. ZSWI3]